MKKQYGRVPKETTIDKIFLTLSKGNQELINKFIEYKRGSVCDSRLRLLLNSLVKFADLLEIDFDKATRDEVTMGWNRVYASTEISDVSKKDDFTHIRQGFKYWLGDDEEVPRVIRSMRPPKIRGRLRLPSKMPSEQFIYQAIKMCRNARDRFFISFCALDGGARPIELRALQWKDLEKDQHGYYFNVWVAKKSGNREFRPIRVIFSEPYFAKWLDNYPGERIDSNYVFSDLNDPAKAMSHYSVTNLFKRLRKKLKVEKFSAYILRHFALDRMSKDPSMPSAVLRVLVGHSKHSTILSEYQHIGGEDLLNMQLSRTGKSVDLIENYKPQKKPIVCPHCGKSNSYDAEMCGFCKYTLSQKTQKRSGNSEEYERQIKELEQTNADLIQLANKLTESMMKSRNSSHNI